MDNGIFLKIKEYNDYLPEYLYELLVIFKNNKFNKIKFNNNIIFNRRYYRNLLPTKKTILSNKINPKNMNFFIVQILETVFKNMNNNYLYLKIPSNELKKRLLIVWIQWVTFYWRNKKDNHFRMKHKFIKEIYKKRKLYI